MRREEEEKMERSLRNAEEGLRVISTRETKRRVTHDILEILKPKRGGADRAFSTAGPWDRRRRERRLFVNSSHSQTPNQISSLNLPGQNV